MTSSWGVLEGKINVREAESMPYGAFQRFARKYDPLWGKYNNGETKAFKVTIEWTPEPDPEEFTFNCEAVDEAEAIQLAEDALRDEEGWSIDICSSKAKEIE